MSASYGSIEVVRGRLTEQRADQLIQFWSREGALGEAEARERLAQVVCVLNGPDGEIAGVNSVYPAALDLVGGREFWVYRNYLSSPTQAAQQAMAQRAAVALQAEFDPAAGGPIGICFLLETREQMEAMPLADWLYPQSRYVGYLADGRQVRIRYFEAAHVGPPREPAIPFLTPDHRYVVSPFAEQDAVDGDAVLALWAREGAVEEEEARRRLDEVVAVGTRDGELVGVATAYLRHNAQVGMDLWHFRAFVAAEHRAGRVGWSLAVVCRDHLEQRFVGGQETRAAGVVFEIENEGLKRNNDYAIWPSTLFTFIGENERGDHVRVHYFPGVMAPAPPA